MSQTTPPMHDRARSSSAWAFLLTPVLSIGIFAPLAEARPREPAPIIYANKSPALGVSAVSAKSIPTKPRTTVEFRYPDQATRAPMPKEATPVEKGAFTPVANPNYDATGLGAVYPSDFDGLPTANGEILDLNAMTAAHPSLPLPSLVQVTNLDNGKEVVVRVNDRGPFEPGSLIEVSPRAADVLAFPSNGRANVRVRYLGPAPKTPSDNSPAQVASTELPQPPAQVIEETTMPPLTPQPQPAPQPVRPARPATPDTMDGYYIQAGSFSEISNAERLHGQLGQQFSVDIVPARVRGTDYFRVVIGPFPNRPAADTLRDRLARQGVVNGFVFAP